MATLVVEQPKAETVREINPLTMEFNPRCPPETLEKAKEWLRTNRERFTSIANFCVFTKDTAIPHVGFYCHRNMDNDVHGERECIATEIGTHRQLIEGYAGIKDVELYRPYVNWLVNESFASRFILNKDDFEECFNFGLVISSDIPTALMQNILIMTRHVIECNPVAFKYFNRLVDEGYPGSVAYAICINTAISQWGRVDDYKRTPREITDDTIVIKNASHRAWACWANVSSFKKFGNGEFGAPADVGSYTPHRHYREYACIYGGKGYVQDRQNDIFTSELVQIPKFRDGLRALRGEDASIPKIANPFKKSSGFGLKASARPQDVTIAEMFGYVLPYLKSEGYFDVAY